MIDKDSFDGEYVITLIKTSVDNEKKLLMKTHIITGKTIWLVDSNGERVDAFTSIDDAISDINSDF